MSESTPILMTLSETCACAAPADSAAATPSPTMVRLNAFMVLLLLERDGQRLRYTPR